MLPFSEKTAIIISMIGIILIVVGGVIGFVQLKPGMEQMVEIGEEVWNATRETNPEYVDFRLGLLSSLSKTIALEIAGFAFLLIGIFFSLFAVVEKE